MASGPGVGAGVTVAGRTDVGGWEPGADDALAREDGDALGEPKRHPERRSREREDAIGAGRRMPAA
jgi:hypothetical protein